MLYNSANIRIFELLYNNFKLFFKKNYKNNPSLDIYLTTGLGAPEPENETG